jgi:endonuclease IV
MSTQHIGLHVSAAGGVENAPENAKAMGAECFQFFSRSPRGGNAAPISDESAKLFRERSEAYGFESYIHTPYYIKILKYFMDLVMPYEKNYNEAPSLE